MKRILFLLTFLISSFHSLLYAAELEFIGTYHVYGRWTDFPPNGPNSQILLDTAEKNCLKAGFSGETGKQCIYKIHAVFPKNCLFDLGFRTHALLTSSELFAQLPLWGPVGRYSIVSARAANNGGRCRFGANYSLYGVKEKE